MDGCRGSFQSTGMYPYSSGTSTLANHPLGKTRPARRRIGPGSAYEVGSERPRPRTKTLTTHSSTDWGATFAGHSFRSRPRGVRWAPILNLRPAKTPRCRDTANLGFGVRARLRAECRITYPVDGICYRTRPRLGGSAGPCRGCPRRASGGRRPRRRGCARWRRAGSDSRASPTRPASSTTPRRSSSGPARASTGRGAGGRLRLLHDASGLDLDAAVLQDHAEDVLVALQAVVVHGGAVRLCLSKEIPESYVSKRSFKEPLGIGATRTFLKIARDHPPRGSNRPCTCA